MTSSGESGIIKSITIEDFDLIVGKDFISKECRDVIFDTLKKQGVSHVYDEIRIINLPADKEGKIEPMRTNVEYSPGYPKVYYEINAAFFNGRSKEQIDKALKVQTYSVVNSLEEAVIHESGHAKVIRGKRYSEFEAINEELKGDIFTQPIKSRDDNKSLKDLAGEISKYAQSDGLECISECHVKLQRGEYIPDELKAFHDKYTGG